MQFFVHIFFGLLSGLGLAKILIHTARREHEVSSLHVLIQALGGMKQQMREKRTEAKRDVKHPSKWKAAQQKFISNFCGAELFPSRGFLLLYLLVGVTTALLFYANVMLLEVSFWPLVFFQVLTVLLLAAAFFDLAFRLIPVLLLSGLILLVAAASIVYALPIPIQASFIGGIVVGVMVLLLYAITRGRGIGEADISMGVIIGGLFGWQKGLLVFSAANILGLLLLLPMIAVFGKKRMKLIPLVFFLVIAIFLEWYLGYTNHILQLILIS